MRIKINKKKVKRAVQHAKAQAASRSRSPWWKPNAGWNHFRLWAFKVGRGPDAGEGDFYRITMVHQGQGEKPQICMASPAYNGEQRSPDDCERCVHADRVAEESGNKAANRLRARERYALLITPLRTGGEDESDLKRVVLWQAAMTAGEGILDIVDQCDDVDDPSEYFGANGLTIKFKYDPSATGRGVYTSFGAIPAKKSITLDPALQAKAQEMDLYSLPELDPAWVLFDEAEEAPPAEQDPEPEPEPEDDPEPEETPEDAPPIEDEPEEAPAEEAPAPKKRKPRADKGKKRGPRKPKTPETEEEWNAKLAADGLADEWEAELHDGKAVFYPKNDETAEGTWDYPEPSKDAKAESESTSRRRGFTPRPALAEDEDATEG